MNIRILEDTAKALVAPGKGLLAADESLPTIKKRFDSIGLESTEVTRRAYREMLFTTPQIENYISGVIMFDETTRQTTHDGVPFPVVLERKGIIPGIKVDMGTKDLPNYPEEKFTEGLDGLRDRLKEYRDLGARFTKWRAVIKIGPGIPTDYCIDNNARALALFAAVSQDADMSPIVEPEVLMDGDHDIEQCREATERTLSRVFFFLQEQRVCLAGMLLKTNMILPGKESPNQVSVDEVARTTVCSLRRVVPPAVPGIVFLSGGQDAIQATEHLNAMNKLPHQPWELSFSFARALQDPAMHAWKGKPENVKEAQAIFLHRTKCNSAARFGKYTREMELEEEQRMAA